MKLLAKAGFVVLLITLLAVGLLFGACASNSSSYLADFPLEKALANGKPTLAEFGWRDCIPCKDMKPILEEMDKEYKGVLNVVIVEVRIREDLAEKYGVNVIPVQIIFDNSGKEVVRHAGFIPKEGIVNQLTTMGIKGTK